MEAKTKATRKTKQGREAAPQKHWLPLSFHKPPTLYPPTPPHPCTVTAAGRRDHTGRVIVPGAVEGEEPFVFVLEPGATFASLLRHPSVRRTPFHQQAKPSPTHHTHTLYTDTHRQRIKKEQEPPQPQQLFPPSSPYRQRIYSTEALTAASSSLYFQASNPSTEPWRIIGTTMTRYVHLKAEGVWDAFLVLSHACLTLISSSPPFLPARLPSSPTTLFPHRSSSISFPPPSCT